MPRKTSLASSVIGFAAIFAMTASPVLAQMRAVDPDQAIDGDLSSRTRQTMPPSTPAAPYNAPVAQPATTSSYPAYTAPSVPPPGQPIPALPPVAIPTGGQNSATFHRDDLIGAAEGVFGKGSRGLATMIEDILKKQGEPNGYIVGREGGGALVLGLRYGSGTLYHKIEGQRPVYWTGPSIGFDAGANAGSAFVLVYNLDNTQDLYTRFGAGEGQAYLVGGFNVSYLRHGNVVLVPVRMGAGLRLGINAGYMKFSEKQNWLPF